MLYKDEFLTSFFDQEEPEEETPEEEGSEEEGLE
jgi:hypothetical protein